MLNTFTGLCLVFTAFGALVSGSPIVPSDSGMPPISGSLTVPTPTTGMPMPPATTSGMPTTPPSNTTLTLPAGVTLDFILSAQGTQNYTCDPTTNTWVSVGALARLSNNSIIYDPRHFVGFHYFIQEAGALSPVFDLSLSEPNNPGNNLVICKKLAQESSPDGANNVQWLLLERARGGLANFVMRVRTVGGQPPAGSCHPSEKVRTVPYSANYVFFK
ncbi:hypothetical protein BZG36_02354 [Bifiguratus adelaidae]|uniref:Malate dehydrogenase n=1 Tax=Bifiguratus adelaidae TaxID=1938954 RepID=A0A261Y2J6_9FUNG|nr:hypothetical protein BZG36_02354 [Bifiguratus adelaidae]